MYLLIDLSVRDLIHLALFDDRQCEQQRSSGRNRDVLRVIRDFLTAAGVHVQSIEGIAVVVGVGGFTSTRLAVTVANTCAYALQIPVLAVSESDGQDPCVLAHRFHARPRGEYISATYSAEPNINRPK